MNTLDKSTAKMMMCSTFGYRCLHYKDGGMWWCSACCCLEEPPKPEAEQQAEEAEEIAEWLGME